jgi:hypothetical protein
MSLPAKHTSLSEVLFLIIKLKKKKKVPGYDLITNKILKNLQKKTIVIISLIPYYGFLTFHQYGNYQQ